MKYTSGNSGRLEKWLAAVALAALLLAGAIYVAPHLWQQAAKNARMTVSMPDSAPPRTVHQNAVAPAAPSATSSPVTAAAIRHIPIGSAKNPLGSVSAPEKTSGKDEFRAQPDTGSADEPGGETGEDPKQRADYFYRQRAYPFDQTPAGARQQSLQQLDAMITQQRALGILPQEEAAVPNSVGFPGPSNWTNIGPQPVTNSAGGQNFGNPAATGRVTAIAVDPTTTTPSSQVVYLGAATGGVWKSTDGGASWNTIFDQNNSLAIGGIAIAPSSNTTIYVGTGELNFSGDSYYGAGVYKSTDSGATWTQQCGGASVNFCTPTFSGGFQGGGFYVGSIAVNPANANIALAAVRDAGNRAFSGIYRTTDGGANWTLIPSASAAAGNSIVWNPSDSTMVYATLGEAGDSTKFGVYKSTDSGVTFTRLTGNGAVGNNLPTSNLGRHEMAVAPSNGNVVYVAINAESTSGLLGLAKSTDGGATWSFTAPGTLPNLPNFCSGQCWYDMALAVLPNDPNTLVVGGSAFTNNSSTDFRTSDGGTTWVDITNGSSAVRPHVDTHVLKFAATTGGFRLYTGNDGGVWFTDTPTAAPVTWQTGNNANLTITQFYPGHAVHPSDENISFGGTQDNGTEKYSGILAWDHVTCGDGAWAAIDPNIPTTVYANCQNIALLRSTLDGVAGSWSLITNEIPTSGERSLFIPPLVQDPNQSGRLYFGTFRVWQSMNYGNDWTPISPDLTSSTSNEVTSVSVAPSNNNVVYATTTDGRVWRTTNANSGPAATWTNLTSAPLPGRYATMVRADHASSDTAYLSYSGFSGFVDSVGHIFKTTNGGAAWTDISGTGAGALPNAPVNDIAVVHVGAPLNFDAVFIATDVGVFECPDPTSATPCQTWSPVGTGLPKVPVVGLAYRENSATIRAVTHGRGVWVIETPGINTSGLLLLTSITPSSAAAGSGAFTMTFDGNDFGVPSGTPKILVDGVDPGVTNITVTNSNHMTATIPASVTANPGLHQITINQPGHAATPQNPTCCVTFSVTGPAPTLSLIAPNQIVAGSGSFSLTATGTNFVCGNTQASTLVQFGITLLTPTACSSTSMTVTVPANLVTTPSSIPVIAFSPGPGGGSSGTQFFTVTAGTPDMTITKSHVGNFTQSQVGATYTITATNSGNGATTAAVNVVDTLPTGLTATALSGAGWACTLGTLTCTRSDVLAAGSGYSAITLTVTVAANAPASVTNTATVSGGGEANTGNDVVNDTTTVGPSGTPDLTITKSHVGNFTQGQAGSYTITVTNSGAASTVGTITVVDAVPVGMTSTGLSGIGWSCTPATLTCTRSDVLANGSSYPAITLTVNVATNAPASLTNNVTVSGGGETNTTNDSASDMTTILTAPDLTITKSHVGNFSQGQASASYTITVTNSGTSGPTSGTVTVVDNPPGALTLITMTGTGWVCTNATFTCTRSDALAAGGSYPAITLTTTVAANATSPVTNSVTVSGGGENNTANDTATDPTTINAVADLTITKTHVDPFIVGQAGATFSIGVTNSGAGSTSGTVTVVDTLPPAPNNIFTATAISGTGWACTLATLTCTRSDVLAPSASYPAITLTVSVGGTGNQGTNNATVSGGGEVVTTNDLASDRPTIQLPPDLTISKSHAGNFSQGQTGATYSINVSNVGAGGTVGTVTVVDTLPTGLTATAMNGTGWACTVGTLTCARSDVLAASAAYPTITLTVNVAANAPSTVTNSVAVSGGSEQNTANDSAIDSTTITPVAPDMTVTKSHVGNFTQGQAGATYTITATNSGGTATTAAVSVVDTLPAGLTATAISGTGWTCTLGTLTCTRSDVLAAAASYQAIILTVTVANNATASVTNTAIVSGGGETNTANDSAGDTTTIIRVADLTITKSHTGNFVQGQIGAAYTITATNSGPGPTNGTVTVVDTIPTGLTATAMTGTGWACTLGTLTCTRTDVLAAASSYPAITLTVTVANNTPASVTNNATVSGGGELNAANDSASDITTVTQASDLTITKTHVGNFTQGQVGATYTITASNAGPGPTNGTVTVADALPAGLTATAIAGTGWACTLGTLTCTRNDVLAAASSYPAITLTVTVANNAGANVTNNATVSGGGEINTANDSATDVATVVQVSDLTITKSHIGNFTQGQVGAAYTITVSNSGAAATSGTVTLVDAPPIGLGITAMTGTGWGCTVATATCTRTDALGTGQSYPAITLTVTVANNTAASVTNSVTVSGGGEVNTANDSATDPTTVIQVADLTITKSHTGNFAQSQVGATYTITVTNSGAGPTNGAVNVADTLPTGLAATAIAGTGWTCTLGTLSCTRNDVLAAAASYPAITLTVTVANNAPASVTNTAAVSGGGEINTANDTANDITAITLAPDLTITKSHAGNFTQGQVGATYTITATNIGPGSTNGTVTIVDILPAGLTATAESGTGWTCVLGTLTCTRSDVLVAAASYPTITLTVTVANNAGASVTNTAQVSGGGEINTANDTANDVTTIAQAADLAITKTHVGNFTQGQVGATYTITASNAGGGPTSGTVTVVDTLPAGLTATAESGAGWTCVLGALTCTRADVLAAAGSYPAISLTVTVANNAAASVTNTATVSGGGEINVTNDTATNPTTITQLADMTITKSHIGNFLQSQTGATYNITATNSGAGATSGTVTVVDTLPIGLTATSMTGTGWTCTIGTLTCTRGDVLAAASSYPAITLTVNVAANAVASVTNTAAISGGGEIIVTNDVANDITSVLTPATATLSVNALSFTNQGVNTASAAKSITVTNNGGATLTFTAAPAITLTNASDFAIATGTTCTNGGTVLSGATCVINITFTPAATGARGPATLTLTDNASPTTQTASLTGAGIDFTESGPTSPVTVTAGQTAMFTITLSPGTGGFANAVTFSASGLPAATSATFNPASVTPGGSAATTVLSIATTARSTFPGTASPKRWTLPQFALWSFAFATILLGLILFGRTGRRRRLMPAMFVTVALLLAIGITGCSSAASGTPAGTSTITITATSGSVVHTTTVTLTVQ